MHADTRHPLPSKTQAFVYNTAIFQRPYIEGRVDIISPVEGEPNFYRVMFAGEALPQMRFVHPDWQCDPGRIVEILTSYWRLNCDAVLARAARIPLIHREFHSRRITSPRSPIASSDHKPRKR